ncbi:efflux transporter outer membrane subunit [Caballeronia sp. LZ032]|uniref:efflux transporter outer membrane subunit n=1 Tax=Caballeronia sp. LZ032 TaxID=3038565 RepID=UPI00286704FB|nr:efflux transporter outer membrane subunit [Caballeronia sp. LZ032]MDR5877136.1 efflux transporter outer membrane subunit [Caballeronia sp. LZ032]
MLRLTLIAAAIAWLAGGCTLAPKYAQPASPVPAGYPADGVYAAQAAQNASATPAADVGWRDFFIDVRLQQLIDIALRNNRDLRVAVLNVQAAQAQYRIARAGLLPSVSAQGGQTKQRTPQDLAFANQTIQNSYSVGLNASWEIDLFGRVQSLKDQALATYFATAYARKAAEISLVGQVATQYLQVLQADDLLAVTRQTLKSAGDSFGIVKLQFDNGTASELDLSQSQTVMETAAANLQAQERARAQAVNALALLLGEPVPDDLPEGQPLARQPMLTDLPAGLPSDLLLRRPDIMEAEQNLVAANANIGAARAAFFPSISLTGSFGTLSPSLGGLFKPGSAAWSFAPTITLPIFSGGQNVANLDLANVSKRIEVARYEKTIQSAFRDVADGLAARGTFDQQIAALERDTAAQQRRLDLSTLRFRQGVDGYLNVLTAQQDLYAAQQTLVSARTQRLANLVSLYQALGGGWIEKTGDAPRPADASS